MDPVTHTLVGVGMANAFFRRRVGPAAIPILAIASNLPDLDTLVYFTGDPIAILARRTLGHSIFLLPFWAFGLSLILKRFWPRLEFRTLFGLSMLGSFTHLFFDLINSFGVVLLWPWSDWRPELAMVFILDLFLTGLLVAPLLLGLFHRLRPYLIPLSRASIVCVVIYLCLCGVSRFAAGEMLAAEIHRSNLRPDFSYVFPEPFGPHRWKGVVRENDRYHLYLVQVLKKKVEWKNTVPTQVAHPEVVRVRETALARRWEWFFKAPVWRVHPNPETGGVSVYDLRFRSLLLQRETPFEYFFRKEE